MAQVKVVAWTITGSATPVEERMGAAVTQAKVVDRVVLGGVMRAVDATVTMADKERACLARAAVAAAVARSGASSGVTAPAAVTISPAWTMTSPAVLSCIACRSWISPFRKPFCIWTLTPIAVRPRLIIGNWCAKESRLPRSMKSSAGH